MSGPYVAETIYSSPKPSRSTWRSIFCRLTSPPTKKIVSLPRHRAGTGRPAKKRFLSAPCWNRAPSSQNTRCLTASTRIWPTLKRGDTPGAVGGRSARKRDSLRSPPPSGVPPTTQTTLATQDYLRHNGFAHPEGIAIAGCVRPRFTHTPVAHVQTTFFFGFSTRSGPAQVTSPLPIHGSAARRTHGVGWRD